jgi:hypothetical protein
MNYPLYCLKVRDEAQFEAFNATIKSPTKQHFSVIMENQAKVVISKTNITEMLYLGDDSTGSISDSYMETLSLNGNSVVSISNSILPQSRFFLSQNAIVSIFNSTTTRGGSIHVWSYLGTMYFNQTRMQVTLRLENSSFRIMGNVIFDEGSQISHIVRDNVTYWNWENSNITRSYGIEVTHSNGAAFPDVSLTLRNSRSGELLWSGLTDEQGKATVETTFTDENFLDSYELHAQADGSTPKEYLTYLTLLSETPVNISL